MTTEQDFAIALAKADFIQSLEQACQSAGGGSWESFRNCTFEGVVDTLSRNGVRMIYDERYHMNNYLDVARKALPALQHLNQ